MERTRCGRKSGTPVDCRRVWALLSVVAAAGCQPGVHGTVRGGGGGGESAPLSGVEVSVLADDGSLVASAESDAQGGFSIPLKPGHYRLRATHPRQADQVAPLQVGRRSMRRLDLTLPATTTTTVFIVRHAEKIHPDSNAISVPLSPEGSARAEDLQHTLQDAGVTAVYSTVALRTRTTVGPLAARMGLEPIEYGSLQELAAAILDDHKGDVVLVGGHSNTVGPTLVALGASVDTATIGDYDNLYMVTVTDGTASALNLQYGADTEPDDVKSNVTIPTLILVESNASDQGRARRLAHTLRKAGVSALYAAPGSGGLDEVGSVLGLPVQALALPGGLREWMDTLGGTAVAAAVEPSMLADLVPGPPAEATPSDGGAALAVVSLVDGSLIVRSLRY